MALQNRECLASTSLHALLLCRLYPALEYLQNRLIFVLTGNYTNNYLEYYPNLVNATMFIAEPYNGKPNSSLNS